MGKRIVDSDKNCKRIIKKIIDVEIFGTLWDLGLLTRAIACISECHLCTVNKKLKTYGITNNNKLSRMSKYHRNRLPTKHFSYVKNCPKCGQIIGKNEHQCPTQSWNKGLTVRNSNIIRKSEEKRLKTWKKLYEEGKVSSWIKGLTKETDDRLKQFAKIIKKTHWSKTPNRDKIIQKRTETRKNNDGYKSWSKGLTKYTHPSIKSSSDKRKGKYGLSGEKNPRWLGGKSFEPYDKTFHNRFKRTIRKRDNYVCLICNIHQEKLSSALNVHHINYDKLLSIPANCCSLCKSCHTKTNSNREHWTTFFQSLLSEKYKYKYDENQRIIIEVKDEI